VKLDTGGLILSTVDTQQLKVLFTVNAVDTSKDNVAWLLLTLWTVLETDPHETHNDMYAAVQYLLCQFIMLLLVCRKTSRQELSYRKPTARQLRTQYVEGISRPSNPVTLKSRLGHWKRNHWIDHTRLTISRVI